MLLGCIRVRVENKDGYTNIKLEGLKNREVENKNAYNTIVNRGIKKNREGDTDGHKKISSKKSHHLGIKVKPLE